MNLLSIRRYNFGRRYRVIKHLATGGMAEVYLAEFLPQKGFSKPVVIKKILSPYEKDIRWVNSFLNEANIMAKLNHSNIVQVHDFGKSPSGYYLSMEYVDGMSLLEVKRRVGCLPKPYVLYIGIELAKALSYAHKQGVLHRDVSPSNILISREGEVKLTDFGVAKLISDALEPTQFLKGKQAYMSPEQQKRQPLTTATDLYSVCVVLSELLGESSTEGCFLKPGLAPNPTERLSLGAALESICIEEMKRENLFVSQSDFARYLSQNVMEKRDPTQILSESEISISNRGRKFHFSWGRIAMAFVMLVSFGVMAVMGTRVPEFYSHGYLSLNARPWGQILAGVQSLGTTPVIRHWLATGEYTVTIRNDFISKTRQATVRIEPNQITKVILTLQ